MRSITQDIKYYQAILSYADQHGVTKAAIKYRTYRQFIYSTQPSTRWWKRWRRRASRTLSAA